MDRATEASHCFINNSNNAFSPCECVPKSAMAPRQRRPFWLLFGSANNGKQILAAEWQQKVVASILQWKAMSVDNMDIPHSLTAADLCKFAYSPYCQAPYPTTQPVRECSPRAQGPTPRDFQWHFNATTCKYTSGQWWLGNLSSECMDDQRFPTTHWNVSIGNSPTVSFPIPYVCLPNGQWLVISCWVSQLWQKFGGFVEGRYRLKVSAFIAADRLKTKSGCVRNIATMSHLKGPGTPISRKQKTKNWNDKADTLFIYKNCIYSLGNWFSCRSCRIWSPKHVNAERTLVFAWWSDKAKLCLLSALGVGRGSKQLTQRHLVCRRSVGGS